MMINKNKREFLLPLGLLILLSVIVYKIWFSFYVFAFGDGFFVASDSLRDSIFPSFWNGGITLWKYPYNFLYGIWGQLGFGTNVAEKFLVFWPIVILAPVAGYLLAKKITKSTVAGIIGSLVFTYNTYFLSIDTQGHIFLPMGFIWGSFALIAFIYLLENKKKVFVPITTLFLFISGSADFRTLYIMAGIIILYFLYNQFFIERDWKSNLKQNTLLLFSIFVPLLFLNLFWLIPNITASSLVNNDYLSRPIIEGSFYNLQNVSALFYPFWTGAVPSWFFSQQIPIYFWLYPILAFLGLIVGRKNNKIVFWGMLALIGIFLTKQDASPLGQIYTLLYDHMPGFSAFREASKFYIIIIISYSVLIASFANSVFNYLEKRKFVKYIVIFLIALLPLWNAVPLLTGSIKTMFVPKTIPSNITQINNFFASQDNYSGIFWINLNNLWSISSEKHQVIRGSMATVNDWEKLSNVYDKNIDLNSNKVEAEKLRTFFPSKLGERFLSEGAYGYVVLNLNNTEFSNKDISAKAWESLGNYLKTIPYLESMNIGINNYLIFKNKSVRPLMYETLKKEDLEKDIAFQKINFVAQNSSHYLVTLDKQKDTFYLNFAKGYHSDWKLYAGNFNLGKFLLGQQKQIPDNMHFRSPSGLNAFYVDPKEICNSYPCQLTLLYKPQGFLYLGLIISIVTLVVTIGSIIYLYKKNL